MNTVTHVNWQARMPRSMRDESTNAGDLHLILQPAQTVLRSFRTEKEMKRFRSLIYSINSQGTYRYRTIRAEDEMWGLILLRMI